MKIRLILCILLVSGCSKPVSFQLDDVTWVPKHRVRDFVNIDLSLPKVRDHTGGFYIVRMSAPLDLAVLVERYASTNHTDSYFCETPQIQLMLAPFRLYQDGVAMSDMYHLKPDANRIASDRDVPHSYQIVLLDSWQSNWAIPTSMQTGNQKFYSKHDLQREPKDVCFQVSGNNLLVTRYRSNVIRVPAEMFTAAFSRAKGVRNN